MVYTIGLMPYAKSQEKELKKLGAKIKAIRNEKGLSLQDLAYSIGKERQSISRLEMGKVNPSYLYLLEVCEGLGIAIVDLLDEIE